MSITTSVVLDWTAKTSTFTYSTGTITARPLFYDNSTGLVTLPAAGAGFGTALGDFEQLTTAVTNWIQLLSIQFRLPLSNNPSIADTSRTIGAQGSDGTFACQSSVTYYGPGPQVDGTMEFANVPGTGIVYTPRPAIQITYANLIYRNLAAYDLITAARTGSWPAANANVPGPVGPMGPPGPTGATGATGATGPQGPAGFGTVTPTTPTRTFGTNFQPNATKAVFASYSIRIVLSGQQDGQVDLYSDASATPTTIRASTRNAITTTAVGITNTNTQTVPLSYIVPAGHYVRLVTTTNAGAPTFQISQQVEETLG